MDDLKTLSTETLYTYMRNALVTSCRAIGHTKSHSNGVFANAYRNELNRRGEKLPRYDLNQILTDDRGWRSSQIELGTYNGPGSF